MNSLFILTLFISGFCGISYEILYSRILGNTLGNHFILNASILIMFLLGIGVGTKLAHRFTGLLWLVEGLIGVYALLFSYLSIYFDYLFFTILPNNIIISTIACLILLAFPTILIGISLPLFASLFKELSNSEKVFDISYTIYNIGACITAFIIEFYLIRIFGIRGTVIVIASLNLFSSISLFSAFRKIKIEIKEEESLIYDKSVVIPLIILSIASAIFQLLFLKISEFVFGPFNETFAMVISLSLLGISIGSILSRNKNLNFTIFSVINIVFLLLTVMFFDQITLIYATYYELFSESYVVYWKMAILSILMLGGAICFGSAIPALLSKESNVAKESGHLLFVSSLANAFGYLLMITVIHSNFKYGEIFIIITLLIASSIIIHNKFERQITYFVIIANIIGIFCFKSFWNENLLYINYKSFNDRSSFLTNLYSYKSGTQYKKYEDVFSLNKIGSGIFFMINGYVSMALNSASEYIVGTLSSMVAPNTENALVLGLGSGSTGSTVTQVFKHTDIVEINPVVVEHEHEMKEYNFDIMNDKRANIVCDDGIKFMKNTDKKYDLILNTVTSPLYFRSSKLYTTDFFKVVKTRLKDDGVYTTWIDSRVGEKGLKIILKSLQSEFNYSAVALIRESYFLLFSSNKKIELHQEEKINNNMVLKDWFMSKYGKTIEDLRYLFLSTDSFGYLNYTKDKSKVAINTSDYPTLEFTLANTTKKSDIKEFKAYLKDKYSIINMNKDLFTSKPLDIVNLVKMYRQISVRSSFTSYFTLIASKSSPTFFKDIRNSMLNDFEKALKKYNNYELYDEVQYWYNYLGELNKQQKILEEEIKKYPKYSEGYYNLAKYMYFEKNYKKATEIFKQAIQVDQENPNIYYWFGRNLYKQDKIDQAEMMFKKAIELDSSQSDSYYNLGRIYFDRGFFNKAKDMFINASEVDSSDDSYFYWLAKTYMRLENIPKAEENIKKAIKLNTNKNEYLGLLQKIITEDLSL